jgi:hypothetical protein
LPKRARKSKRPPSREFGISPMTLWRWDHDRTLSFPAPIRIRNRKFRSRRQLEETKARMLRDAMAAKAKQPVSSDAFGLPRT